MFYLEKCAYKDCSRSGSVALENGDPVCNLHKKYTRKLEVQLEEKEEEKQGK